MQEGQSERHRDGVCCPHLPPVTTALHARPQLEHAASEAMNGEGAGGHLQSRRSEHRLSDPARRAGLEQISHSDCSCATFYHRTEGLGTHSPAATPVRRPHKWPDPVLRGLPVRPSLKARSPKTLSGTASPKEGGESALSLWKINPSLPAQGRKPGNKLELGRKHKGLGGGKA